MINRSQRFKSFPLNISGSSTFGRYPKISIEKTYNMFASDGWQVPYAGYMSVPNIILGKIARGIHTSTKLNRLIAVVDNKVYSINIFFDQNNDMTFDSQVILLGTIGTSSGVVYITENNKPQVVISDGDNIYYYDPLIGPGLQIATADGTLPINFTPGFIDFHDTYILCAASDDETYAPPANNTWRLGTIDGSTGKLVFPSDSAHLGLLQTKPDNTQAVVRFPSKGNMIFVMGEVVSEAWMDTGYQLFPYTRSNQMSIDYGCLNPATVASLDEIVVWLGVNEKSGPIILYSTGGPPEKITTDGIDYLFSQLSDPADSQAFLYRQDGHLFYHINFFTDNLSLFYDFNTKKFYHACDQNLNVFIASQVAFFNNQYYFIANPNPNNPESNCLLYAFDTIFTTYDGNEIPRFRTCKNVRDLNQEYFIANDVGFTIETGETPYQEEIVGPIYLITQDGQYIITQGSAIFFVTQAGDFIVTQDDNNIVSQQTDTTDFDFLISQQSDIIYVQPRVDLSISIDGGVTFSSDFPYVLNPLAQRRNKLMWWQIGLANDLVCQFKFWGLGRFVCTDGEVNVRQ
jgi:hypothetical protein